jgi:micrococcal nuclease
MRQILAHLVGDEHIQDNAAATIYRLESIDCPETEERAKCCRERQQGERAKFEAIRLLKGAKTITVRPTGKIDQYGRSIASIDVDGHNFGRLMIARGFARPWRGVREDWCGPNGGLAHGRSMLGQAGLQDVRRPRGSGLGE